MTCVAFSIKFAKTHQKLSENSEFCEKNSLSLVNYSLHSLVTLGEARGSRGERRAGGEASYALPSCFKITWRVLRKLFERYAEIESRSFAHKTM